MTTPIYVAVTGTLPGVLPDPETPLVTFTPSGWLPDPAGGLLFPPNPVYVRLTGSLSFEVQLLATDTTATAWTWQAGFSGFPDIAPFSFSFALPSNAVAFTGTSGTPCVLTVTGTGFTAGQPVTLAGTALPAGLAAGTVYYVTAAGTSFSLAAAPGGAALASTSAGSGQVVPVADISALAALAAGGNDFLTKPYSPPILLARVTSQITIARGHARLRRHAMTDELTGVYTRRFLFDSLRVALKSTTRSSACVACLLADVDHFKSINDSKGHLEGDRVLRQIARTIASSVRDTDLVARYGGEEFAIILTQTDLEGALEVAEKIRTAVSEQCPPVTISIGASAICDPGVAAVSDPQEMEELVTRLLRGADTAVYAAKSAGRNRVESDRGA